MNDWTLHANCLGLDPEIFFPGSGDTRGMIFAKSICAGCDVRAECLEYALAADEHHGIWGGLTGRELRRLQRQRRAIHLRSAA